MTEDLQRRAEDHFGWTMVWVATSLVGVALHAAVHWDRGGITTFCMIAMACNAAFTVGRHLQASDARATASQNDDTKEDPWSPPRSPEDRC